MHQPVNQVADRACSEFNVAARRWLPWSPCMCRQNVRRRFLPPRSGQSRTQRRFTAGCLTVYAAMTLIGLCPVIPHPFGLIVAASLTLLYVGLIAMFGHRSIIEMGLLAVILLVLSVLIAAAVQHAQHRATNNSTSDHHLMQPSCKWTISKDIVLVSRHSLPQSVQRRPLLCQDSPQRSSIY